MLKELFSIFGKGEVSINEYEYTRALAILESAYRREGKKGIIKQRAQTKRFLRSRNFKDIDKRMKHFDLVAQKAMNNVRRENG